MRRTVVAALLMLPIAGCVDRCGDLFNARATKRYVVSLAAASDGAVTVIECRMFPGTRKAHCQLSGTGEALEQWATGLGLGSTATRTVYGTDNCLVGTTMGEPDGDGRRPRAGIEQYVPTVPLPPNTDNVVLQRLYLDRDGGAACLELSYPYG